MLQMLRRHLWSLGSAVGQYLHTQRRELGLSPRHPVSQGWKWAGRPGQWDLWPFALPVLAPGAAASLCDAASSSSY